jgi:hypothetical protein
MRNAQQVYADCSEVIFFCSVSPHLTRPRVNAAVEFKGHTIFEAVEIDDPVLNAVLAPEFRAQPPAPQRQASLA